MNKRKSLRADELFLSLKLAIRKNLFFLYYNEILLPITYEVDGLNKKEKITSDDNVGKLEPLYITMKM